MRDLVHHKCKGYRCTLAVLRLNLQSSESTESQKIETSQTGQTVVAQEPKLRMTNETGVAI